MVKQDIETTFCMKRRIRWGWDWRSPTKGFMPTELFYYHNTWMERRAAKITVWQKQVFSAERFCVDTIQTCYRCCSKKPPELELKPLPCTCDARLYSSLYQDPNKVHSGNMFGPEATNIHGVEESVSLDSMKEVMDTIAMFIRDWCGLIEK